MRMVLEDNDNIHVSTCLLFNNVLNNFYTNDGDQLVGVCKYMYILSSCGSGSP